MKPYHELLNHLIENGRIKKDRTGTGTHQIFGHQMRFDLSEGFPLMTTKKVHMKSIIHELLWFLSGDTNVKYLQDNNVSIWNEWAHEDGSLGPVYSAQWRSWPDYDGGSIDQITKAINTIKNNPNDRGNIVCSWNVAQLKDMALRPCHCLFQFDVTDGKLSLHLFQRSADTFLGVPFNIASYALLIHMIAQQCDLEVGEFIWTGSDVHLYANHVEQAKLQLSREERPLPKLIIKRKPNTIFDYKYEDFDIIGYNPHPGIKAPIAI